MCRLEDHWMICFFPYFENGSDSLNCVCSHPTGLRIIHAYPENLLRETQSCFPFGNCTRLPSCACMAFAWPHSSLLLVPRDCWMYPTPPPRFCFHTATLLYYNYWQALVTITGLWVLWWAGIFLLIFVPALLPYNGENYSYKMLGKLLLN